MNRLFFFSLFILISPCYGFCQLSQDSLFLTYRGLIPIDLEVFSGGLYVAPPAHIKGDPYFVKKGFEEGKVWINGLEYANVPLMYNTLSDDLITFHPIQKRNILIYPLKIDGFEIQGEINTRFIRLEEGFTGPNFNNGFFELVQDGTVKLLIKHSKELNPRPIDRIYTGQFLEKSDYFLFDGERLQVVRRKKDTFDFLEIERKTMRKKLRKDGLDFKIHRREYLSYLVNQYNTGKHE